MFFGTIVAVLLLIVLTIAFQIRRASGTRHALLFSMITVSMLGAVWGWSGRREPAPPEDQTGSAPITAQTCLRCHESHYASWHRTYHRTMTREATPEYVKGNFDGAPRQHLGVTVRMIQDKNRYFMECEFPDQAAQKKAGVNVSSNKAGNGPQRMKLSVDRLVGSHWVQQLLHRDDKGRYLRLPMAYHVVEDSWIHINGRFLAPDNDQFLNKFSIWNNNCVYCHNTRPVSNPQAPIGGAPPGYRTTVGELGISCEACHGAGERHVRAHQNPLKRLTQPYSTEADPTIVNPAKLSAERSVAICAHCHGGGMQRFKEWNQTTYADPYLPGRDLKRFWYLPFSDVDRKMLRGTPENPDAGACCDFPRPHSPDALDGRFWGDGTPLSTAVEYQGMAMSACYEGGHGKMTCLTCHAMHKSDPNQQVKEGMRTNAGCYSCHESYRAKLAEHTHHAAGSQGSLCYNCHMPRQAFGLLSAHPTHRITIPRVRDSMGTGKPHACNLCHLDKSLGWTQEQLGQWYQTRPESLSDDERTLASSLLHLAQSDARTRAVFAGAFSWPPAQEASGRDWPVLLLTRVLEHERYQVVRYTAHKALRSLHGKMASGYHYQDSPAARAAQLQELRLRLENSPRPDRNRYPHLPLTAAGLIADDVFERLLKTRNDPDVAIKE